MKTVSGNDESLTYDDINFDRFIFLKLSVYDLPAEVQVYFELTWKRCIIEENSMFLADVGGENPIIDG